MVTARGGANLEEDEEKNEIVNFKKEFKERMKRDGARRRSWSESKEFHETFI